MYNTLKTLCLIPSISGREERIREKIKEMISPLTDECYTDNLGNLIAVKRGNTKNSDSKKKIMLCAQCDENGFAVTYAENNGILRFDMCGETDLTAAAYGDVVFENGVKGILIPEGTELNARRMHIDIGAKDQKDALKKIKLGDFCAPAHRLIKQGTNVCGTALDGRLACAVLIKTAEALGECKDDIYFVFTGRQTVGFRGA